MHPISKNVLLIIVIVGVIIFLMLNKYLHHKNENRNKIDCYSELNKEVSGVVKKAFFDDSPNHEGFVIEFTNGNNYHPLYLIVNTNANTVQLVDFFEPFCLRS
jgi:hypothetical protein